MQPISRLITTFLLNSLWQVSLITFAAYGCSRLARTLSASRQHVIWVAGLALSIAVPFLMLARRSSWLLPSQEPARVVDVSAAATGTRSADDGNVSHVIAPWMNLLKPGEHRLEFRTGLTMLLAGCYLLFVLYRVIRFWLSWRKAIETRRSASCMRDDPIGPVYRQLRSPGPRDQRRDYSSI